MKPTITKHTLQIDSSKTFCAVDIETTEGNASYGYFILTSLECTDRASEHEEIREYGFAIRYDDEGGEFESDDLQDWVRDEEPYKSEAEEMLRKSIGT